jgi:hypothetical protein
LKKLVMNLILTEELGAVSTRQTPTELPQNTSIEQLDIANVKEAFVIQMLNHFGSQSKLKRLSINTIDYTWRGISNLMSFSFSKRLQQLLESSSTLQSIELLNYYLHPSTFEPISVGVMRSQSLQKIALTSCKVDSKSALLLQNIFQCPDANIQTIEISFDTEFETPMCSFLSEIISSKPMASKLTEINLAELDNDNKAKLDFATFLRPLEEVSTLEHLNLGFIGTPAKIQELLSCIPRMRGLKEITFHIQQDYYKENTKLISQAFRQNWSFEKVNCFLKDDNEDLTEIHFDCARNKIIRKWIQASQPVPANSWYMVFASALEYEYRHDVIFRGLLVLGDGVGQQRSLKRSPPLDRSSQVKSQKKR